MRERWGKNLRLSLWMSVLLAQSACFLAQNAWAFDGSMDSSKPRVMTTFTILQDMTRTIGGAFFQVDTLVGTNGDPHTYQPTADDAKKLAKADLIIANGLHFEGWMDKLIESTGSRDKLVLAAKDVPPRHALNAQAPTGHHDHGNMDPHAWQDVRNARLYVRTIAEALKKVAPSQAESIERNARTYDEELAQLDSILRSRLAAIPPERRKIITSHDAFGYYEQAYGITFLSPVGISTSAEPSASEVAALIRQIKQEKVRLVFIENMTNPRLVSQLAKDTGITMGGELFTDSLSPVDGLAPSYIAMQRHNLELMLKAMKE